MISAAGCSLFTMPAICPAKKSPVFSSPSTAARYRRRCPAFPAPRRRSGCTRPWRSPWRTGSDLPHGMAQPLSRDHGGDVVGLQHLFLIVGMNLAFLGHQKPGSHLNAHSAQQKGRGHASSVANAAGRQHGQVRGVAHLRHQHHGGQVSHMPPDSPPSAIMAEARPWSPAWPCPRWPPPAPPSRRPPATWA